MKIVVICFFAIFFLTSLIAIVCRIISILKSNNKKIKIELYKNGEMSTNLSDIYVGRLSDASVRSSVRYHNSLYKVNNDYENYRNSIRKLELP